MIKEELADMEKLNIDWIRTVVDIQVELEAMRCGHWHESIEKGLIKLQFNLHEQATASAAVHSMPCIHILSNQPLLSLLWSTLHQVLLLLLSELQSAVVKRVLQANQQPFSGTPKSHYVKVCDWMWSQGSWVRSAIGGIANRRVVTGLPVPFAHCTARDYLAWLPIVMACERHCCSITIMWEIAVCMCEWD